KSWKSLRDTYTKERKKEAERKRSGAGASSVRPWRYSGVMGFLNPFLEDRITASNMVEGFGEALAPEEREDAMVGHSEPADLQVQEGPSSPSQSSVHIQSGPSNPSQSSVQVQAGPSSPSQSSVQRQTGHSHRRKRAHNITEFDERILTALEAVSRRASAPQEDSDSLSFKSLLEDFRTLSLRTRQDLKFQIHKLVYEAKCLEAGLTEHWGESNGGQLTSL
ncbi:hypothetical protein M9458_035324, partial [Cirrhinus mrigala]